MGGPDELRCGGHELLEARPLRDAATEQEGAHPAVDEQRPPREAVAEAVARQRGPRFVRTGDVWQAVTP